MTSPGITLPQARTLGHLVRGQGLHLVLGLLLLTVSYALAEPAFEPPGDRWMGLTDRTWFDLAAGAAVVMQVLVWIVWRLQLGWGLMTRVFGRADMVVWSALFLPLLLARPVLITALALADRGSLEVAPWVATTWAVVLLVPALYAVYSVARYFGIPRAVGGDHFRVSYRRMPLVREGVYRWTSNAMYQLVFLLLWSIALFFRSHAALVAVLFQHAYIWVHYQGTEKPDMQLLYGSRPTDASR